MNVLEKKQIHNISYIEYGEGDTLVLIHGYLCSASVFEPVIHTLAQKFRVIVPDLPGHGSSPIIEKNSHVDDYAFALLPFFKEVCPQKFWLYGHSMGAYIALAVADKIPQCIERLGLINASAQAPSSQRRKLKEREKKFILNGKMELIIRNTLPYSFKTKYRESNSTMINNLVSQALKLDVCTILGTIEAIISRPDRTLFLKTSGINVDYLIGASDQVNDKLLLEKEVCQVNTFQKKVFLHSAHFIFLEEKHEFTQYLSSKGQF